MSDVGKINTSFSIDLGDLLDNFTSSSDNSNSQKITVENVDVSTMAVQEEEEQKNWFDRLGDFVAETGASAMSKAKSIFIDPIKNIPVIGEGIYDGIMWIGDMIKKTAATFELITASLVEGILGVFGSIFDLLALVLSGLATIGTGIYDLVQGNDWEQTKELWDHTQTFVESKFISNWFDSFYENNGIGQSVMDNALWGDTVRSVGSGIGYVGGTIALSVLTMGIGGAVAGTSAAGTVAASGTAAGTMTTLHTALTAGTLALSRGTQDAWSDGADVVEGLGAGVLTGVREGGEWALGGWINKAAFFNSDVLNSISHVVMDAVDAGTEGLFQPLITTLYKDGYYDDNGDYIKFTGQDDFFEKYAEMFDDAGGWANVGIQAVIGGATSALSEGFELSKLINKEQPKLAHSNVLNPDGSYNPNGAPIGSISVIDDFFSYFNASDRPNYGSDQGAISNLYMINGRTRYPGDFETVIAGQSSPVLGVKVALPRYGELRDKLVSQGFTQRDASLILSGLDSAGACSYASNVNELLTYFKSNSADFYRYFGFSMYQQEPSGQYRLNTEELLLDLYLFANNVANGGRLFEDTATGKVIRDYNLQEVDIFNRHTLNADDQQYLASVTDGRIAWFMDRYLKSKNPELSYASELIYNNSSFSSKDFSKKKFSKVIADISNRMNRGETINLDIYTLGSEIRMIPIDVKGTDYITTSIWDEGSGHSVFVTGLTDEGFVVSSWGSRYLIPFVDLINGGVFDISASQLFGGF